MIRCFVFITYFIYFLSVVLPLSAQPKYEIRAIWLTTLNGMDWPQAKAIDAAGVRKQQNELCRILDKLQSAHFNTVLLQTRIRGDVLYPSDIETFAEILTGHAGKDPGYDPLAFAIEECHKRGMEIHAWMVTVPIGNDQQVESAGKKSLVRKRRDLCKHYRGTWYLDPGNPSTQEYLSKLVCELVGKYDIDGVHLDYIRYPERASSFPDKDTFKKYGRGMPFTAWRRNNITTIVRRLYQDVKALKPWVKVSSSPIGKYRDTRRYTSRGWNALHTVYQEAQQWLKEGIQDALFPMMYFKENDFYPFALDWKEHKNNRWIVPGLGVYFLSPSEQDWPLDEIVRQVNFIREIGLDGQAYFRNRFVLDNTKQIWDELTENTYAYPALIPPMTWIDRIAPDAPTHPSVKRTKEGHLMLSWNPSIDNSNQPVTYHLYGSDTYPVDIRNPKNLITTYLPTNHYPYKPSQPWLLKRYLCVTAADRFGNESVPLELNKASEDDLPILNDGDQVTLPHVKDIRYIRIATPTGHEVLRIDYANSFNIQQLHEGFYWVYLIDKEGRERLVGTILK